MRLKHSKQKGKENSNISSQISKMQGMMQLTLPISLDGREVSKFKIDIIIFYRGRDKHRQLDI